MNRRRTSRPESLAQVLMGVAICLALGTVMLVAAAIDPAYQTSVEKWRQQYQATITADDGWLTVTGLFWLHDGDNHFGSDPLGDIVLSGKSVPPQVGTFTLHNGKVIVHGRPGVKLVLSGKAVDSAELHADVPDERLQLSDFSLFLHASGTRLGIRVKDKNSKTRREFSGLHWFPIDPSYRVVAKWEPYPMPKTTPTQNIVGDFDPYVMIGQVEFTLQGKSYKLEASENTPGTGTLFIVFRDLTSGHQTDAAARFMVTAAPKSGTVELDFNKAYNPPCAFTAYATCPLPSPGNRMRLAILAGEKNYKSSD